jgi:uncharacterized membrane protein
MVDTPTAYLAILVMVLVTLGTRLGGAFIMRFVALSPRITGFLEAMSASVLAAVVVTFLVNNGTRELAAVGVAMLVMLATRSAVWAMIAALLFAAGWTALVA